MERSTILRTVKPGKPSISMGHLYHGFNYNAGNASNHPNHGSKIDAASLGPKGYQKIWLTMAVFCDVLAMEYLHSYLEKKNKNIYPYQYPLVN